MAFLIINKIRSQLKNENENKNKDSHVSMTKNIINFYIYNFFITNNRFNSILR